MLERLAGLAATRPRAILFTAMAFIVVAGALGMDVAHHLRGLGVTDSGAESSHAAAILDEHFPATRPDLALLVTANRSIDDPVIAGWGRRFAARLAAEPSVVGVSSYWRTGSPELRSRDGRQALIVARIKADDTSVADRVYRRIAPRYSGRYRAGDTVVAVRIGGATAVRNALQDRITADLTRAELFALPLTLIVLVIVFGGLIAALLPLGLGITAIIGTSGVLTVVGSLTSVSVFAQNLTTALGLGLAIDYALLIVRRFREELGAGADPAMAISITMRTAGRAVLFSALTVGVSLAAMLVFPLYFLRSFAYAGVSVVALAAAGALLPLPAALVLLGRRIDALSFRRRRSRRARAETRWVRLATAVMRRRVIFAAGTTALLIALGLPFFSVKYGSADDRQLPRTAQPRVVQQAIRANFESRATGVTDIVVRTSSGAAIADYARRLSQLHGIVRVDSPAGSFQAGQAVPQAKGASAARMSGGLSLVSAYSSVEDISGPSLRLVQAIRDEPAPAPALTAGLPAELLDSQHAIRNRLGWAIGIIVATTLLLVFLLTGSILLPVKTVVTSALSLTAMFGAVVWVFQDGHLSGLLGFTATGFIETSLPVLMFCVAFGLSMDYGVFLMARIREEYDRTGDNTAAAAYGLARSGGIITSAAAVLAIVLAGIGTSEVMNMKMIGVGLAIAVVMDATVVRCLLLPSAMAIAGRATWWAPQRLRRLHPRYRLRETPEPA